MLSSRTNVKNKNIKACDVYVKVEGPGICFQLWLVLEEKFLVLNFLGA